MHEYGALRCGFSTQEHKESGSDVFRKGLIFMPRLEDLTVGSMVNGWVNNESVQIVAVKWHGNSVLEATHKNVQGMLASQLVYRENEVPISDRVTQYTSNEYQEAITLCGILQSMNSDKERCYDNVQSESMWARLKEELFYGRIRTEGYTVGELKRKLPNFS